MSLFHGICIRHEIILLGEHIKENWNLGSEGKEYCPMNAFDHGNDSNFMAWQSGKQS